LKDEIEKNTQLKNNKKINQVFSGQYAKLVTQIIRCGEPIEKLFEKIMKPN
jgi:hypothetical protein